MSTLGAALVILSCGACSAVSTFVLCFSRFNVFTIGCMRFYFMLQSFLRHLRPKCTFNASDKNVKEKKKLKSQNINENKRRVFGISLTFSIRFVSVVNYWLSMSKYSHQNQLKILTQSPWRANQYKKLFKEATVELHIKTMTFAHDGSRKSLRQMKCLQCHDVFHLSNEFQVTRTKMFFLLLLNYCLMISLIQIKRSVFRYFA